MVRDPNQPADRQWISGCFFNLAPWILFAILIIGAAVTLIASNWALPGDSLYPAKRWLEDTRLNLTQVPSQRYELEMKHDIERQEEVNALQSSSKEVTVEYVGGFSDIISDREWKIGERTIKINPDTEISGRVTIGTYTTVTGILEPDGEISAEKIQPREYIFQDELHSVASNQWLVDGLTLIVAHDTFLHGAPAIGSEVKVATLRLLDDQLVARLIEEIEP